MINLHDAFAESNVDDALAVHQLYFDAAVFPGPGGDDDDSGDDNSDDQGSSSDDNDPPLDGGVVHSPVTPQPGGKPQSS